MKTPIVPVMFVVVAVAGAAIWRPHSPIATAASPATQPATPPTAAVVGVEELMRHVDRHKGEITVEGVVSNVAPADQKLAMIDTKEFQECHDTGCAELILPVRWSGAMPAVKQTVRASGQVKEVDGGKLMFVATDVRIVPQPGGQK